MNGSAGAPARSQDSRLEVDELKLAARWPSHVGYGHLADAAAYAVRGVVPRTRSVGMYELRGS